MTAIQTRIHEHVEVSACFPTLGELIQWQQARIRMEPTIADSAEEFLQQAVHHGWFQNEGVLLCRVGQATVRAFTPGSQQGTLDQIEYKEYVEGEKHSAYG